MTGTDDPWAEQPTQALPRTGPTEVGPDPTRVGEQPRAFVPAPTSGDGGYHDDGGRGYGGGGGSGNGAGGGGRGDRFDRALVIAGLLVVAVIIGVGAYLLGKGTGSSKTPGTDTTTTSTSSTTSTTTPGGPSTTTFQTTTTSRVTTTTEASTTSTTATTKPSTTSSSSTSTTKPFISVP